MKKESTVVENVAGTVSQFFCVILFCFVSFFIYNFIFQSTTVLVLFNVSVYQFIYLIEHS